MKIILTGSLGNIGKLLAPQLIARGHKLTISSNPERRSEIEDLGAKAAIGQMQDLNLLTETFIGADLVYLMETMESVGDMFDPDVDFISGITAIGQNYKAAVQLSGVKKAIHLSSLGAHTNEGNGILLFHHRVEQLLQQLPVDIAIKFIRPAGFYLNLFSFIPLDQEAR
ncbi:SDR family oxidoreductase [Mucilaginibacter limnophilus]|uniref:SDR family oxidoreductase n=1 Tax=Mucilaginibacter limnophilus TaxID=1932778 RepID=UPI00197BAA7C|nr:NAD(P)H-binding protein [Mucilaginibacter limnophilus]